MSSYTWKPDLVAMQSLALKIFGLCFTMMKVTNCHLEMLVKSLILFRDGELGEQITNQSNLT